MLGGHANRCSRKRSDGHCSYSGRVYRMFTSLFELLIQTARPPVAGPVWLQVHGIEDSPDGTGTDGRHDAVVYGLASQILAGPVGDVQAFGDWFQAGPFDDLGTLEGGEIS
jgi:hypothetical protein